MSALRRYEILLPRRFNDGTAVPEELLADTATELREQFGAMSWETQIIRGEWEHEGVIFRDELLRIVVDAPPTPEAQRFFVAFKESLKARFQQIEMWITWFDIGTV
ncbi:MAG: hypothetical protein QOE70_1891 [Chthoniobacter sp.]|jgi:hypothetical protein|nr:hypothetical protein [Chthoniobacter sp.]